METGQAGGTIVCACGQKLEIPTLRGLRQLEPCVEVRPARRLADDWGPGKGAIFVIALLLLMSGLCLTAWALWSSRQAPYISVAEEQQHFSAIVDELPLSQLYEEWKLVRDSGMGRRGQNPYVQIRRFHTWMNRFLVLGIALSSLGLVGVIGPLLMRGSTASVQRPVSSR